MKIGISVTLDYECIVWLNKRKGNKSKAVNDLIMGAIGGQEKALIAMTKRSEFQGKAIDAYVKIIEDLHKEMDE